jgi:FkbM family methyltransferase
MLMKRLFRSWSYGRAPRDRAAGAVRTPPQGPERLTGRDWLVRGRHGLYVASENDVYVGRALVHYGEFSELEWQFLRGYCRAADTVVEVGANIGAHTVTLSKAVGPAGRVVAIEPQPVIFRMLCANLALNGALNVDTHQCGCGAAGGTMSLPPLDYESEKNFGGISLEAYDAARPACAVPIRRLDDLLEAAPRVDLIKIDVEGMETEVLNGASTVIDRFRPTLYVENDRVPQSKMLIETLAGMGYRMWWHIPPLFNPDNYYGEPRNLYPGVGSFNMLCLHRSSAVAAPDGLAEITDATHHPLSRLA